MRKTDLPEIDEIVFAVSEAPLGEGAEAQVFKIHTNPNFTVRKRLTDMPINELAAALKEAEPVMQPDIFGERNFAQTVAYFNHPKLLDDDGPVLTVNRYCPGFSFEVYKPGRPKPDSEEALIKTRLLSEKMLEIPERAIDFIYDDLHYLSSKKYNGRRRRPVYQYRQHSVFGGRPALVHYRPATVYYRTPGHSEKPDQRF